MPQPARNRYDFAAMEEFAAKEREVLHLPAEGGWAMNNQEGMRQRRNGGIGSEEELAPQSYDTGMDRTTTMSAFGDEPDSTAFSPKESESAHGTTGFHRRRQRKLSQSNPVLRRGGRLALFEGIGSHATPEEGEPADNDTPSAPVPFKSRAPKNPLSSAAANGFAPYTDTPAGHDRPYRFSFYSNNLPVTIHARTLAELPAEGQTFEDLFKGRATMDETRGVPATGSGSLDSTIRRSTTGSETPEKDPNMAQPNGKMSLLARAAGTASKAGGSGPGQGGSPEHDPEAFTWWMDVHSPTDEEMRMLSKVCHAPADHLLRPGLWYPSPYNGRYLARRDPRKD
jgi:magnesium transporter